MDSVNKTLYIPLYGKAYVSRKDILLKDTKAEEIWKAEGVALKGKSKSKWLAYYMGMRSAVFDRWLREKMQEYPDAVILHLGCGMDSRAFRIGIQGHLWFDVDFPEVISERKRYFQETETYRMISYDLRNPAWLGEVPKDCPILAVMEGVSMYLAPDELEALTARFREPFSRVYLLMDCYSEFAAKASKYKNPINDVGVTKVYGLDDPGSLSLTFRTEHELTPDWLINQLSGIEKAIFKAVFAGRFSKKLYRLYEFSS